MSDVLILGGGVIGLSLAWQLAKRGQSVHVIDCGLPGREASWAGAGIIPAAVERAGRHPYEQLRGLACSLHEDWARELRDLTGIDTGYRRCGGLHLARTPGEAAALTAWADLERQDGIESYLLSPHQLAELEPNLAIHQATTAICVPAESQLRNPRYLKALVRACELTRVKITPNVQTRSIEMHDGHLALETSVGRLVAGAYCFTAGAWTGSLLQRLGVQTGILPIRGQMVLFRCGDPPITHIINEGSRYLVPRGDGRVLAGSTEEEVGFNKSTTEETIADLTSFARGLVPTLERAEIEQTWAGLRPGSFDGLPYLGPLPGTKNAFVAAGHFRSGLYMSTATAQVMTQLILGDEPSIDLSPFRMTR